ncbi:RimK/LysX family protein [Candidatus Woesearchaeota archaeon]|nr:RimK/LysX family protein [Candidatus Woesearchaeota archaeon]
MKKAQKKRKKEVIGLTEKIMLIGPKKARMLIARIDTGATLGSIDKNIAKELKLGPVLRTKLVKSSHGQSHRPVIKASVKIGSRRIKARFTLADRRDLKYKVLIGQNILKKRFMIDPDK